MKKLFFISILFVLATISCKDAKKPSEDKISKTEIAQNLQESQGYKLMEQKCFICHFPVPNPEKRAQMIAPPMLRVQEHYKPAYPNKADFVEAIKKWVNEPSEDKIQMPGAARKFKIMPYLSYSEKDITQIAETLFEIDFGSDFNKSKQGKHKGGNQKLQLNKGEKWKLNARAIASVKETIKLLDGFQENDVKAYQNLGKEVFQTAKTLILDQETEKEKFEQVQAFFHNVEEDIHQLMQVKTVAEGQKLQEIIKKKFSKFFDFFE